jgi:hypothetical protein
MEDLPNAPTPITKSRRAQAALRGGQMAEVAALRLENERLSDPELPEYVLLWGIIAKGTEIPADQIIGRALLHRDYAEACDAPMCLEICESFIEYVEGRDLARAAESRAPAIVLPFRKPSKLSAWTANQMALNREILS